MSNNMMEVKGIDLWRRSVMVSMIAVSAEYGRPREHRDATPNLKMK